MLINKRRTVKSLVRVHTPLWKVVLQIDLLEKVQATTTLWMRVTKPFSKQLVRIQSRELQ